MAADYVSKEMINKAMQVDLLEYAKSLGMEFETRGSNNTLYQKGHSLNITRSKNMYYHFSTGKGGNVINFAMEQNGWTFQQAVRSLCGECTNVRYMKMTNTVVCLLGMIKANRRDMHLSVLHIQWGIHIEVM